MGGITAEVVTRAGKIIVTFEALEVAGSFTGVDFATQKWALTPVNEPAAVLYPSTENADRGSW